MKGKILIVDDERTMRKSLEEILKLEGFQVTSVGDGKQAMEVLETSSFDLMLLDLKMPGVDGLEVLKFASENAPKCKVIMLTAHGSLESAIEALREGAHDYILKPARPEELIASVSAGISEKHDLERKQLLLAQMEASIQELRDSESAGEPMEISRTVLVVGNNVKIDLERREIWTSEEDKVQLTPTEGKLMQILLENRGRVLSHKDLVFLVQGYQTTDWEAPEIMRPLVSRLRRKLAQFEGGDDWIINVRGTGYVFDGK
ncbi:MAG: response regulator transcription factor [Anaerolineales bacterium]|nr:response regulator transcription factor [Anaerolineales bacterium]